MLAVLGGQQRDAGSYTAMATDRVCDGVPDGRAIRPRIGGEFAREERFGPRIGEYGAVSVCAFHLLSPVELFAFPLRVTTFARSAELPLKRCLND
jgi:hypothetical protein